MRLLEKIETAVCGVTLINELYEDVDGLIVAFSDSEGFEQKKGGFADLHEAKDWLSGDCLDNIYNHYDS